MLCQQISMKMNRNKPLEARLDGWRGGIIGARDDNARSRRGALYELNSMRYSNIPAMIGWIPYGTALSLMCARQTNDGHHQVIVKELLLKYCHSKNNIAIIIIHTMGLFSKHIFHSTPTWCGNKNRQECCWGEKYNGCALTMRTPVVNMPTSLHKLWINIQSLDNVIKAKFS